MTDSDIINYKEYATEAVRDFAERMKARVKERLYKIMGNKPDTKCVLVGMKEIAEFDELVEEMEGEV